MLWLSDSPQIRLRGRKSELVPFARLLILFTPTPTDICSLAQTQLDYKSGLNDQSKTALRKPGISMCMCNWIFLLLRVNSFPDQKSKLKIFFWSNLCGRGSFWSFYFHVSNRNKIKKKHSFLQNIWILVSYGIMLGPL